MRIATLLFAAAVVLRAADLSLSVPEPALSINFSSDGKTVVAICQDGVVRYWDVQTGVATHTIPLTRSPLRIAALSDDGTLAATSDRSGEIRIWNLKAGELWKVIPAGNPRRPDKRLDALRFSPDNKRLASAGRERRLHIFDLAGREPLSLDDGVGEDIAIAFSRDGNLVAAPNSDTNLRVWNARTGKMTALLDQLPLSLFALTFSADGKHLAGGGVDRAIYVFNTGTWQIERKLEAQPEMILALALSADGRILAAGGNNELSILHPVKVLVWNLASGKVLKTFDSPHTVAALALSPDGKHAAAATMGNVVKVWRID